MDMLGKTKYIIFAFISCALPVFAQTNNSDRTNEIAGDAVEALLFKCASVKTADYPYEYTERNYFFDKDTKNYDLCKYLALETNISFLLYETIDYLGYELGLKATLLPILGVKADAFLLQNSNCDFVGNGKAGVFIPLMRHDFFNLSIGASWCFFVDFGYTNGCAVDLSLKMFPIKPLSLEFNFVEHCYDQSFKFNDELYSEFSVKTGFLVKAIEFYAEWRYFRGNMWGLGVRRYF